MASTTVLAKVPVRRADLNGLTDPVRDITGGRCTSGTVTSGPLHNSAA
jgi:hypothetical protein